MRDESITFRATRYLPHVVLATAVVALLPIGIVWLLRAEGVVSSPWLCVAITILLSLATSMAGSAYWKRRPGSGDMLFSELLLWGWLRRVRIERQLDRSTEALGLAAGGEATAADRYTAQQRLELLGHLNSAMEAHDPYVEGHSRRVARHATGVARKLGLTAEQINKVASAAAVHDVGKLRLPREVLMKPGALTDEEFEIIKRHSSEGAEMVDCLGDPELTAIVRHHHERLDGTGYPAGLVGEDIPLGARIIAVADTFDAITSARPYRPAARHKQAIDILEREAGSQLDAAAVRAFISYYSGRRVFALWALLAAAPQRAFAAARRAGVPSSGVSAAPTAATVTTAAATIVIGAAAVVPPIAVVRGRHERRALPGAAQLVAAAPATTILAAAPSSPSHPHPGGVGRVHRQFAVLVRVSHRTRPLALASLKAAAPVSVAAPLVPSSTPAPRVPASPSPTGEATTRPTTVGGSAAAPMPASPAPTPSGPSDTSNAPIPPATPPSTTASAAPATPSGSTPDSTGATGSTGGTGTGAGGGTGGGGGGTGGTGGTGGGGTGGGGTGGGGTGGGGTGGGGTGGGPPMPTTRSQCLHDAWELWPVFTNQRACVSYVNGGGPP